jgi:hypothetical protein
LSVTTVPATTRRLAAALHLQASRAYTLVQGADRDVVHAALDGFLAAPAASTYLRASRLVAHAVRAACRERLGQSGAERAFQRGLSAIQTQVGPELAGELAGLPVDARAGHRLTALAHLLGAHRELAGRALAATRELRERLGYQSGGREPAQPVRARRRPTRAKNM